MLSNERADPLVAIKERELLEHAHVRQLHAEQADRQRPRPRRHEHLPQAYAFANRLTMG
jgi:hypothetical protein